MADSSAPPKSPHDTAQEYSLEDEMELIREEMNPEGKSPEVQELLRAAAEVNFEALTPEHEKEREALKAYIEKKEREIKELEAKKAETEGSWLFTHEDMVKEVIAGSKAARQERDEARATIEEMKANEASLQKKQHALIDEIVSGEIQKREDVIKELQDVTEELRETAKEWRGLAETYREFIDNTVEPLMVRNAERIQSLQNLVEELTLVANQSRGDE